MRLGAVYSLSRQQDQEVAKEKLLGLLNTFEGGPQTASDEASAFLSLHTAILLSQRNSFEGVRWILQLLETSTDRTLLSLAETALRNCTQFPIAVLLVMAAASESHGLLGAVFEDSMQLSDDDFFAVSQKPYDEQQQELQALSFLFERIRPLSHPDREIAVGTILSQPVKKEFGYRFTGFIGVERGGRPPVVVPYDLGDILNRDDRFAQQGVGQLLRATGRRAIVVYNAAGEREAQVVYLLPFAPLDASGMDRLIAEVALGAEGIDVAVVIKRWKDERGEKYRMLSAGGRVVIGYYHASEQRVGNCFFMHEANGAKTLSTRYRLGPQDFREVLRRFAQNDDVELAACVKSWSNKQGRVVNKLATSKGYTLVKEGETPQDAIYGVETAGQRRFSFELPEEIWQPTDRSRILQAFFDRQPEAFGVALETFKWNDGTLRVRMVGTQGEQKIQPLQQSVEPGTLVYWEKNEAGESFATIVADQRIEEGCPHCYGVGFSICHGCGGTGRATCHNCKGNCKETCGRCSGAGKHTIVCNNCGGSRTLELTCGGCNGSGIYTGTCKICEGRGHYADSGRACKKCGGAGNYRDTCRRCSGRRTFTATCRRCDGKGSWDEMCKACRGSGIWNCGTCSGSGRTTCSDCGGYRIAECFCGGTNRGTIAPVASI